MIKYNDNNIYVGYIKQLLSSFNLPSCRVYKSNYKFANNELFIYKDGVYRANQTGSINEEDIKSLKRICKFEANEPILNLTKTLNINSNIYDAHTHRYLGEYLRFIRDYYDVDLMSMYNCFSNESPKRLTLALDLNGDAGDGYETIVSTDEKDMNIFMVSVKPDTTYTFAMEYPFAFHMFYGFYGEEYIQFDNMPNFEQNTWKSYSNLRFNHPITIKTPALTLNNAIMHIKDFKLFIVLPANYLNNIVILEGDYANCANDLYLDDKYQLLGNRRIVQDVKGDTQVFVPYYDFMSRKQLLQISTFTKYLLADRLVEFLSRNVVTPLETVVDNIKRVKVIISTIHEFSDTDIYVEFSDELRDALYMYVANKSVTKDDKLTYRDFLYDELYYVDKDVEKLINELNIKDSTIITDKKTREAVLEELGGK